MTTSRRRPTFRFVNNVYERDLVEIVGVPGSETNPDDCRNVLDVEQFEKAYQRVKKQVQAGTALAWIHN